MTRLLGVLACIAIALMAATTAQADKASNTERLVVRGVDTVVDGPCGPGGCPLELTDGAFRGTLGTGAYAGAMKLKVADAFPNGEGGVCAPVRGKITLGLGTPDRLVLALEGDSCQDGSGPVTAASFTGLATFKVVDGSGKYRKAHGYGLASFTEGADDREQMTLMGRISR